jgi:hypothetical protein
MGAEAKPRPIILVEDRPPRLFPWVASFNREHPGAIILIIVVADKFWYNTVYKPDWKAWAKKFDLPPMERVSFGEAPARLASLAEEYKDAIFVMDYLLGAPTDPAVTTITTKFFNEHQDRTLVYTAWPSPYPEQLKALAGDHAIDTSVVSSGTDVEVDLHVDRVRLFQEHYPESA